MKTLLLASAALIATGTAAAAQTARPAVNWGGCHIGVQAGLGWNHTDLTDVTGFTIAPTGQHVKLDSDAGALGGVVFGCDYQFAQNWVAGFGGDFSFADITGSEIDPFFGGKTVSARTQWVSSLTGRVGYSWSQYLLYVKGGAAFAREKYTGNNACGGGCNTTATETRSGWTAGAGFEWAFNPRWSMSFEYDHYGFAARNFNFTGGVVYGVKSDIDTVKIGINYRFGGPFL